MVEQSLRTVVQALECTKELRSWTSMDMMHFIFLNLDILCLMVKSYG